MLVTSVCGMSCVYFCFLFFKQKTAYEMRISDWSSDVCSSDLYVGADLDDALGNGTDTKIDIGRFTMDLGSRRLVGQNNFRNTTNAFAGGRLQFNGREIGRASCRARGCQYV